MQYFEIALIAAGITFRITTYLMSRPLEIDEQKLVLNILSRSFLDLTGGLDFEQTAPVPFLWAVKFMTMLGGVNEYALRLIPLLVGILLLMVTWRLARAILTPPFVWVVTAGISLSPWLLRYATEIKPYELDALVSCVLLLVGIAVINNEPDCRPWLRLGLLGVLAILVSTPSVFTLAGIGLGIIVSISRDRETWNKIFGLAFSWGSVFSVLYLAQYHNIASMEMMQRYWNPVFLTPEHIVQNGQTVMFEVLGNILYYNEYVSFLTFLFGILILIGCIQQGTRLSQFFLFAGPILIAFLVSAFGFYPIHARLMLYAAPLFFILSASGLETLLQLVTRLVPRNSAQTFAILLVIACFSAPATMGSFRYSEGLLKNDPREAVATWRAQRVPGDAVYITARGVTAWLFYTTDWENPDLERLAWFKKIASAKGPAYENRVSRKGSVLPTESEAFTRTVGDHLELIGTPTGMEWRPIGGFVRSTPDPGWLENEITRLQKAGPRVWLFSDHDLDQVVLRITDELKCRGIVPVQQGMITFMQFN
ncbi:mannosyltransferase [Gammaproteobacteria bacterium]